MCGVGGKALKFSPLEFNSVPKPTIEGVNDLLLGFLNLLESQFPCIYKFIYLFYYLFLAALGLRCCMRAFSSCGERGLLFVAVRGLFIAVASLVAEHGL